MHIAGGQFEELRELCTAAGDKASLAIGMAGLLGDLAFHDRICEASELASEAMDLIESIGDPTLTVGLALMAIYAKLENAEWSDVLRWSQAVIDLADGDPSIGGLIFGSPLPIAVGVRGIARYHLGRVGWREDVQHGLAMARSAEPYSRAVAVTWIYNLGIPCWRPGSRRPRDARDRGCPAECRTIR